MTTYTIEVRAIEERYDVLAHQVARELLLLPSLDGGKAAYPIRTAQLYHLAGSLTPTAIDQLTHNLFIDPVTQQASISSTSTSTDTAPTANATPETSDPAHSKASIIVDVFFHPGVTDTLAESILAGAALLGIHGLEYVETGQRYFLDGRLSEDDARFITEALLYNPVIQQYTLRMMGMAETVLATVLGITGSSEQLVTVGDARASPLHPPPPPPLRIGQDLFLPYISPG